MSSSENLSPFFEDLSAIAQTAFGQLQLAAKERDLHRTIADVAGSFNKKVINDVIYWYYQQKDADGRPHQTYLGRESPQVRHLMEAHKDPLQIVSAAHLARLSASAIELGAPFIAAKEGRVITKMIQHGFFQTCGVLIGAHAFKAYQNHLGVRWTVGNLTGGLGQGHPGHHMTLAVPNIEKPHMPTALDSLEMGFLPAHPKMRLQKSAEQDFDIEFVSFKQAAGEIGIRNALFGIPVRSLDFIELMFEQPYQAVLLLKKGAQVVRVPRPEYFALHSIIMLGDRNSAYPTSQASAFQSGALVDYFLRNRPVPLVDAYTHVMDTWPDWSGQIKAGLAELDRHYPAHQFRARIDAAISQVQSENGEFPE